MRNSKLKFHIFFSFLFVIFSSKSFALNFKDFQSTRKAVINFYLKKELIHRTTLHENFSIIQFSYAANAENCIISGWDSVADHLGCSLKEISKIDKSYNSCEKSLQYRCHPSLYGDQEEKNCVMISSASSLSAVCEKNMDVDVQSLFNQYKENPTGLQLQIEKIKNWCSKNIDSKPCLEFNADFEEIEDSKGGAGFKQNAQDKIRSIGILDACKNNYEEENSGFFAKMIKSDRDIISGVNDGFTECERHLSSNLGIVFEDFNDDLQKINDSVVSVQILNKTLMYDVDTNLKALLSYQVQYADGIDESFINLLKKRYANLFDDEQLNQLLMTNVETFKNKKEYIEKNLKAKNENIAFDFNEFGEKLNNICKEIKASYKEVKDRGIVLNSEAENEFYSSKQNELNVLYETFKAKNAHSKLLATNASFDKHLPFTSDLSERCAEDDIDLIYNKMKPADIDELKNDFGKMMFESLEGSDEVAKIMQTKYPLEVNDAIKNYLKYKPYLFASLITNEDDLNKDNYLAKFICKNSLDIYNTDEVWNIAEIGLASATIAGAGAAFLIPGIGPLVSASIIAKVAAVGVVGAEGVMAYRKYDDASILSNVSLTALAGDSVSVERSISEIDRANSAKKWAAFDGAMSVVGSGAIGAIVKNAKKATLVRKVPNKVLLDPKKTLEISKQMSVDDISNIKANIDYTKLDFDSYSTNPNFKHFVSSYSDLKLAMHNGKKYFLKEINGPQMLQEYNVFNTLDKIGVKTPFLGVTQSANGRLYMVSDFVEGALLKKTVNGYLVSGLDETFKISKKTYDQINDFKSILLKNGIESNDLQFIITKNGDVSLIDVDAYRFLGDDLTPFYQLGTPEYASRVNMLSKRLGRKLEETDYIDFVNHQSDGLALKLKDDYERVLKYPSKDVLNFVVDDVTTVRMPRKVTSKKWHSKLSQYNQHILREEMQELISQIKFAKKNGGNLSEIIAKRNNDLILRYKKALEDDGVVVALQTSEKFSTDPKVLNLVLRHSEAEGNPIVKMYLEAARKFKGESVTISIADNVWENSKGFFSSNTKRVEIGYEALINLFKNQKNTTSVHELRHLLFDAKRQSDIPSKFHLSFTGSSKRNLYGNTNDDIDFYDQYMSAEELYTHASDVWELGKRFDKLSVEEKLESIALIESKVDGVVTLSENAKSLLKTFNSEIGRYKVYDPKNFSSESFVIKDVDDIRMDINLLKKDKIIFSEGIFEEVIQGLKSAKLKQVFLKKYDDVYEYSKSHVYIGMKKISDLEYEMYMNLLRKTRSNSPVYTEQELSLLNQRQTYDIFYQIKKPYEYLLNEMRQVYYQESFYPRVKLQVKSLLNFASKQNDDAKALLSEVKLGVDPMNSSKLQESLTKFGKTTRED